MMSPEWVSPIIGVAGVVLGVIASYWVSKSMLKKDIKFKKNVEASEHILNLNRIIAETEKNVISLVNDGCKSGKPAGAEIERFATKHADLQTQATETWLKFQSYRPFLDEDLTRVMESYYEIYTGTISDTIHSIRRNLHQEDRADMYEEFRSILEKKFKGCAPKINNVHEELINRIRNEYKRL